MVNGSPFGTRAYRSEGIKGILTQVQLTECPLRLWIQSVVISLSPEFKMETVYLVVGIIFTFIF